jgi:hypothetical protein
VTRQLSCGADLRGIRHRPCFTNARSKHNRSFECAGRTAGKSQTRLFEPVGRDVGFQATGGEATTTKIGVQC